MYCNKCGAQLVEGAGFCAFCGSRRPAPIQRTVNADGQAPTMPGSPDQTNYQQPVQPPMQQPPMQQPVQQSTQQRSPEQLQAQRRLWLIIAAAVLGALLLIGGGVGIFCCVACGDEEPVEDQPGYVETIPSDEDAAADFTDQLALPENGEEIAVFETTAGTFRMRLFPGNAPETVENFTNLVRSGYYDGITFHRVIKGFMIQSGDPTGTGAGGDTFTGEPLKDEYGNGLYHFRYAVSMANTGMPDSGSSQFFIVQANTVFAGMDESGKVNELTVDQLITQLYYDEGVANFYRLFGGTPTLDAECRVGSGIPAHTVFGQVFEGAEVIDTIANTQTDANDKPLEDVVITRAYLDTYTAE